MIKLPNNIKKLLNIEKKYDIVSIFQYKNTSAWITIKELLTTSMYDSVRLETGNKKDISSLRGIRQIVLSLKEYLYHLKSKEKKSLLLGASTGFFKHKDKVLDAYFPYYDVKTENTIYMVNCGNLRELIKYKKYLSQNHIVIENYLVVVFKKLFSKVIYMSLKKENISNIERFSLDLKSEGLEISTKRLRSKYAEFIAGYKLYRLFFKFLNIDKAYIVSASTKSDMVAALKSLNVEVIEIQHGIVGGLHRGYNFNFTPTTLLPTVDKIDVYNQFWKDEIVKAKYFKEEQIRIVGRLKYDIVQANIDALNFDYIIFTGQGAFFEKIISFFKESDSLLTAKVVKMFYKAHPRELDSEIEAFKESTKYLKSCSFYEGEHTTEELIKNSFAHISVFSSCHFDAVYYLNKTYILDVMEENIMSYYAYHASEKFTKIMNMKEILNEVDI